MTETRTIEVYTQLQELLEEVELLTPLSPILTTPTLESCLELSESDPVSEPREKAMHGLLAYAMMSLMERANIDL